MLYEAIKAVIEKRFPSLKFSSDDENKLISIPPRHPDVGSLDIQDDYDELTVFVGNFTHWHSGYFNGAQENLEQLNEVIEGVVEYLEDMFSGRIFMWGSVSKGGGTILIEDDFKTKKSGFVWSGPYHG